MRSSSFLYEKLRQLILPLNEIDASLPQEGKILDLGCGQGVIATYIAQKPRRNVIGIDENIKRLKRSRLKNLSFKKGDITKLTINKINGVVISDVLHHLKREEQKTLLQKIFRKLDNKGVLVIKEIDKDEIIRSNLSRFWDYILYPKDEIYYWENNDLKNFLKNLGFSVTITRPCRFFPGSTTLYVCKK